MATKTILDFIGERQSKDIERNSLIRKLREINQRTESALYWYRADEDELDYLQKALDDVRKTINPPIND